MRNHIRKSLTIFIMACIISLLPSFQSQDAIESHDAKVALGEDYQVSILNEQTYAIVTYNISESMVQFNLESESVSAFRKRQYTLGEINSESTTKGQAPITLISLSINPDFSIASQESIGNPRKKDNAVSGSLNDNPSDTSINADKDGYIDGLEESEYWWLCKIVMAEVGYVSYEQQLAIACEILNRLKCWYFPNTIYEVIMQPGQYYNGPPRFTDSNGVWREVEESDITDSVKKAVHAALTDGIDYSNGAYFHIKPSLLSDSVVENFYSLYGEPCLELEGGLFFTADLCDSLEEWQEKYILDN